MKVPEGRPTIARLFNGGFKSLKPIESRRDEREDGFVSAISAAPSGLARIVFTPTVKTVYLLSLTLTQRAWLEEDTFVYRRSASHRPGVATDPAVSQSRQRLECGDLSPLSSVSASQLAADSPVPRAKAPTSWRSPNAAATAKPAVSLHTCRVRNALNTYKIVGYCLSSRWDLFYGARTPPEVLAHSHHSLERQIAATDTQIDQLLCDLYGLTGDEIKIVEEAPK